MKHQQFDHQQSSLQLTHLPKLTLERFSGEITSWSSFWSQYEIAIHLNPNLAKPEKFAYLKSYLEGPAATAIAGLPLSEGNCDSAITTLKERFRLKDMVINAHIQQLLKLSSVRKVSDTKALRKLYDSCETERRNLEAMGVKTETYGNLLSPILMQLLPDEITLEFSRKKEKDDEWRVDELLLFLRKELESRERALIVSRANFHRETPEDERKGDRWQHESKNVNRKFTPTMATLNAITQQNKCLFCNNLQHDTDNCKELSVTEKKGRLKILSRSFRCLGYKHIAKFSRSNLPPCSECDRRHHRAVYDKISKEQGGLDQKKESVANSVTHTRTSGKTVVVLQTVRAIAEGPNSKIVVRCLHVGGSQRTFTSETVSRKRGLPVSGEETLSLFTSGGGGANNTTSFLTHPPSSN